MKVHHDKRGGVPAWNLQLSLLYWGEHSRDERRLIAQAFSEEFLSVKYEADRNEFDEYAQRGECWFCGNMAASEVGHLIDRSRGGSDLPDNLRPSCRHCNVCKPFEFQTKGEVYLWRQQSRNLGAAYSESFVTDVNIVICRLIRDADEDEFSDTCVKYFGGLRSKEKLLKGLSLHQLYAGIAQFQEEAAMWESSILEIANRRPTKSEFLISERKRMQLPYIRKIEKANRNIELLYWAINQINAY